LAGHPFLFAGSLQGQILHIVQQSSKILPPSHSNLIGLNQQVSIPILDLIEDGSESD
jgi:hypothetical protein